MLKVNPLHLKQSIPNVYDAVVISDYNKGTVTYELIEELAREVTVSNFY